MCGILGVQGEVCEESFRSALDLMAHRGPDAAATLHRGGVHLGHRRLSIIDLSEASNQPMTSEDGSHSIVFNGEIYNFAEIREALRGLGHTFLTAGDTEVVLAAYREWGPDCLQRFNGMFALGIVDHGDDSLFLARDRLGIKPLLYHSTPSSFAFASEEKSLVALSAEAFQLDLDAVVSYLCFRYPASGGTFFRGIESLPQGHWMMVEGGEIVQIERYWSLRSALDLPLVSDPDEAIAGVRERLESAIRLRMIADVPVGAYLSGGVDSSAVAALMAREVDRPVHTFTIGFPQEGYNEFEHASLVADLHGTDHEEITIDIDDYMESLLQMIRYKDAPLGVPNEVPLHLMSKVLRKDITVVLSGEGADEIFGGYGRIFRSADDAPLIEAWEEDGHETDSELGRRLMERYGGSFDSEFDRFMHLYRYTPLSWLEKMVSPHLLAGFQRGATMTAFEEAFVEVADQDFAIQMMYVFERLHLPGLLQRVDATTMGTSVEARVPFVDHELVEYAFRLHKDLKMRWRPGARSDRIGADASEVDDVPKWVLKEALTDLLPDSILHRRKVGFPVPLQDWFEGEFLDEVETRVLAGALVTAKVLSGDGVRELFEEVRDGGDGAMILWMLLNLEVFLESQPALVVGDPTSTAGT